MHIFLMILISGMLLLVSCPSYCIMSWQDKLAGKGLEEWKSLYMEQGLRRLCFVSISVFIMSFSYLWNIKASHQSLLRIELWEARNHISFSFSCKSFWNKLIFYILLLVFNRKIILVKCTENFLLNSYINTWLQIMKYHKIHFRWKCKNI